MSDLACIENLLHFDFYLFPVDGSKKPLIKKWKENATNKVEDLPEMFTPAWGYHPQIAISCEPSGLFVLDVDHKNDKNGFVTLQTLEDQYGSLPPTVMVKTPHDGVHYYFRGVGKSTVGTLGLGLDTRGCGGYVVCPPSVSEDGNAYVWCPGRAPGDIAIAEAPLWLLDLAAPPKSPTASRKPKTTAETILDPEEPILEGCRNDTLYRKASSLRSRGLSENEILTLISRLNSQRCSPPLEREEVCSIVASSGRYAAEPSATAGTGASSLDALEALTDLGNARRMVQRYGADIRSLGTKKWVLWDGTHWKEDTSHRIQVYAEHTVECIPAEAEQLLQEKARQAVLKHAKQSQHHSRLKAMVDIAAHQPAVVGDPAQFDCDPWLLNVHNGTIDLSTGVLHPHRRQDYLTKLLPITYDPGAQCPQWLAFLTDIMCDNAEMVAFLQRAVGYTLTGQTDEQCLFILYGTGANGKSVFLSLLKHLLGPYGTTAEFATFTQGRNTAVRNDVARLHGARLVAAAEGEAGEPFSEALVKTVTGGDTITARFLYHEHFEFVPQFKMFLVTNHKPVIRNQDEGIWRRIRLIPFTKSIPKADQNPHLAEVLQQELPGILRWAVEGCLQWQQQRLQPPALVLDATEEYQEDMDALKPFLESCFELDADSSTSSEDITRAYLQWCGENDIRKPLAQGTLIARLKDRGFRQYRTNSKRGLTGLKLTSSRYGSGSRVTWDR